MPQRDSPVGMRFGRQGARAGVSARAGRAPGKDVSATTMPAMVSMLRRTVTPPSCLLAVGCYDRYGHAAGIRALRNATP